MVVQRLRRGGRTALVMMLMAGAWCAHADLSSANDASDTVEAALATASTRFGTLAYRIASTGTTAPSWGSVPPEATPGTHPWMTGPSSSNRESSVRWERALAWGASNAAAMVIAYRQSQAVWGESRGKFHFKDDLRGDGMALNDEVSHLFAAFQLTRALNTGYRWVGMDAQAARRASALEAWLWTFAVEFPIDAFNPDQGFGVSDLVANTVGVIAAHNHTGQSDPRWDVKISVKPSFFNGQSRVIAHTNQQYDDYIYWLTVRPVRSRWTPFSLGVGYSTTHGAYPSLSKEVHVGVGASLDQLGMLVSPEVGRFLRPLSFYFLNLGGKIAWR